MRLSMAMRQIINNQTMDALRKSIAKTIAEAAPHIQIAKENNIKILNKKMTQFNNWYMKITGLDKVNLAQEKVNALQDQLLKTQEKRRDVGRQLLDIREKSMELQDEIHKVKRQEDLERFLELMKKETEILKLERSISKIFQDYDQTERELFTAFTDSIRDSHEKQRAQMEYTKYFGVVLSIAGSFLAFIYSTLRKEQLKQIIDERLQSFNYDDNSKIYVAQLMDSQKKLLEEILSNKNNFNDFSNRVMQKFTNMENYNKTLLMSNNIERVPTTVPNNMETSLSKGFFNENTNYVQVFGVALGLWLIWRVLSG